MDSVKKSYLSKTLWLNAIIALSALFIPSVGDFLSKNPEQVAIGISVLNIVLRFISKDKLELW